MEKEELRSIKARLLVVEDKYRQLKWENEVSGPQTARASSLELAHALLARRDWTRGEKITREWPKTCAQRSLMGPVCDTPVHRCWTSAWRRSVLRRPSFTTASRTRSSRSSKRPGEEHTHISHNTGPHMTQQRHKRRGRAESKPPVQHQTCSTLVVLRQSPLLDPTSPPHAPPSVRVPYDQIVSAASCWRRSWRPRRSSWSTRRHSSPRCWHAPTSTPRYSDGYGQDLTTHLDAVAL